MHRSEKMHVRDCLALTFVVAAACGAETPIGRASSDDAAAPLGHADAAGPRSPSAPASDPASAGRPAPEADPCGVSAAPVEGSPDLFVYAGDHDGLSILRMDGVTGAIRPAASVPLAGSGFGSASWTGDVSRSRIFAGSVPSPGVFTIEQTSGRLARVASVVPPEPLSTRAFLRNLVPHPSGQWLIAHYGEEDASYLAALAVVEGPDGRRGLPLLFDHCGDDDDYHHLAVDPSGRRVLLACGEGTPRVGTYALDASTGALTREAVSGLAPERDPAFERLDAPGMAFAPGPVADWVLVHHTEEVAAGDAEGTRVERHAVSMFSYRSEDGVIETPPRAKAVYATETIEGNPPGAHLSRPQLVLHPGGGLAFVTTGFAGGIATLHLDGRAGTLSVGATAGLGCLRRPGPAALSPDGRFLVVGDPGLAALVTYRVGDDGTLTPAGRVTEARAFRKLLVARPAR